MEHIIYYQSVCSPFDKQQVLISYGFSVITAEDEIKDEILNRANINSNNILLTAAEDKQPYLKSEGAYRLHLLIFQSQFRLV